MDTVPATTRRTFLFTDIESSTRLWDEFPDAMLAALDLHDRLIGEAVRHAGGEVVRHTGDGVVAVFRSAAAAVLGAVAAQREIQAADWGGIEPMKVRMGVHTGDVVLRDGEHHGWALNVTSRLLALAHGGQVLVSATAIADMPPDQVDPAQFVDLGLQRLRDIAEPVRVYAAVAAGLSIRHDSLRSSARAVATVHRPLTSFVGREDELERVAHELEHHHVVTIAGMAGVGKSRLAVETATQLESRFRDGVVMCELAGVSDDQVGVAVAGALGVERRSLRSADDSVIEWLSDRSMLLVLDTCEFAPASVRRLVTSLVRHAPRCHVLATSQEPLSVEGERVVRLQPLALVATDGDGDAVELFLQRARSAGALVDDDEATRAIVGDICRSVDGLPLAIEVAASNAGSLSLHDIAHAVRSGELTSAGEGRRSVADALDLAFDRLTVAERSAFTRCSVFAGTFDRAAFAAVAAPHSTGRDVLDLLRSLVDRSLIAAETRRERTRFRLLVPVRAHAEVRADAAELVDAHRSFITHYVGLAEVAAVALRGADEARWVAQLELDFDNLRAAHRRGLALDGADASIRIVVALWDFAFMRMRSEIFDWGEVAAAAGPDHPQHAPVLGIVALGGWLREHPAKATAFAEEALRLERETGAERSIPARMALMNAAEYGGAKVDVKTLMAELLTLTAASASPYWQVNADVLRVLAYSFAGRREQAETMAADAIAHARMSENPSTIAWALFAKGTATELSDADHAEALLEDGLALARSVDNGWIGAMCLTRLASLRRRRGAWADSMLLVEELLDTWHRAGHRAHLWAAIDHAALCLAVAGDRAHAVMLHEAAALSELRAPKLPTEASDDRSCLERLRSSVDPNDWNRWAARGSDLDQPTAMRLAAERMAVARGG